MLFKAAPPILRAWSSIAAKFNPSLPAIATVDPSIAETTGRPEPSPFTQLSLLKFCSILVMTIPNQCWFGLSAGEVWRAFLSEGGNAFLVIVALSKLAH